MLSLLNTSCAVTCSVTRRRFTKFLQSVNVCEETSLMEEECHLFLGFSRASYCKELLLRAGGRREKIVNADENNG